MNGAERLDPTKKHAPSNLGRVLVLGLGKSGRAAAAYLLPLVGDRVESVTVAAGDRTPEARALAEHLESCGATVSFGHDVIGGPYDICIASPGIPQFSEFYRNAQAASAEVVSEVEFAWRESPADTRWVAVTGTNGKTTTTSIIAHVLTSAGTDALAVGNIGDTCLEAIAKEPRVFVAETSSYQLASTALFAPDVAVVLNITPDHLSWHQTFENYRDAKYNVLANLGTQTGAMAVLDATDPNVREKTKELKALRSEGGGIPYIPIGAKAGLEASMREACGSENAAFLDNGILTIDLNGAVHRLIDAADLQIKGSHNVSNALAAASTALALGVCADDISRGLSTFAPLEHRIEPCGSIGGVNLYNDSKATNVDATLHALDAFGSVKPIVLLGGDDKGTDLAELVAAADRHCKAVVCFGAAKTRFFEAFDGAEIPVVKASELESALDTAIGMAEPGDVIVLSPACASFDEFTSFEHRGRAFKDLVALRSEPKGAD